MQFNNTNASGKRGQHGSSLFGEQIFQGQRK